MIDPLAETLDKKENIIGLLDAFQITTVASKSIIAFFLVFGSPLLEKLVFLLLNCRRCINFAAQSRPEKCRLALKSRPEKC